MQTLIPSTLRRERNKRKLTLDVVSTAAEMSIQHLSEIESGKRDPRLSSIERIAMAMGLSLSELFGATQFLRWSAVVHWEHGTRF